MAHIGAQFLDAPDNASPGDLEGNPFGFYFIRQTNLILRSSYVMALLAGETGLSLSFALRFEYSFVTLVPGPVISFVLDFSVYVLSQLCYVSELYL